MEDAVRNRRQGRGNPRAQCGRPGPGAQTSGDHRQGWPQRVRVLGIRPCARGCCQDIWLADAEGRCSSPTGDPTSSQPGRRMPAHRPGKTVLRTRLHDLQTKQAGGGHCTNSATPHSPTSANKERPPSCCSPRADTKTHAPLAIYAKPGNEAVAELTATFDRQRSPR